MRLSAKTALLTVTVALVVGGILAFWTAERMRAVLLEELAQRGEQIAVAMSETRT